MNEPRHRDHGRGFGPSMMIALWPEDEWCPGSAAGPPSAKALASLDHEHADETTADSTPRTVRDDAPVRDDDGIGVFRVLVPALLVSVLIWLVLLKMLTWAVGMFAAVVQ